MYSTIKSPTSVELGPSEYTEFAGAADAYLTQIDSAEVMSGITQEDIATARVHPSGFLVIQHELSPPDRTQGQLRIHLWPEGIDRSETDPHRHPWHLASKVIAGTYVEQLATIQSADEPEDANFDSYQSQHQPGNVDKIELTSLGPVIASFSELDTYSTGDIHNLSSQEFHFTPVAGSGMLVTTMLTSRTLHGACNLKLRNQQVGSVEPPRAQPTDVQDIWRQLQDAR